LAKSNVSIARRLSLRVPNRSPTRLDRNSCAPARPRRPHPEVAKFRLRPGRQGGARGMRDWVNGRHDAPLVKTGRDSWACRLMGRSLPHNENTDDLMSSRQRRFLAGVRLNLRQRNCFGRRGATLRSMP
jgi:hypothetical protein